MIKKVNKVEFYNLVATIQETYDIDTRIEECHGQHVFEDTELIKKRIVELKIVVGNKEVDILFKLSQDELNTLLSEV